MSCIVSRCMDGWIREALKAAHVANRDTERGRQWLLLAEELRRAKKVVCRGCERCREAEHEARV